MFPSDVGFRPSPIRPPQTASRTQSTAPAQCQPRPALTAPQQQTLAQRFAPVLYFHPDEKRFLQSPMTFIEQSTLREERDLGWKVWQGSGDREVHGLGDVPPEALSGIGPGNRTADDQLFLDHQNEALGDEVRTGDLDNSQLLYEYDAETKTITYHLFYAYNDGPPGVGTVQNHEGDWERITVQLDDRYQPTAVRYSAHNGLDVERSWAQAPKEDGRPVAYVAQGSHANYPAPGSWTTNAPFIDDKASSRGLRFDLADRPAVDVTRETYYGGYVLWGERGSAAEAGVTDTSGPTGPSADKGPITDADRSREPAS
jgi:hypothetical protein